MGETHYLSLHIFRQRLARQGIDVSLRTLTRWCERGAQRNGLEAVKIGGRWRIPERELTRLVMAGNVRA